MPFAATKKAPVLLTEPPSLRQDVGTEIQRVLSRGGTVYILGGFGAVSPVVEQQVVGLGYQVVRFQGPDRYRTALAIAEQGRTFSIGNHAGEAMKTIGPVYQTFQPMGGSDRYGTARAVAMAMTSTGAPTAIGIATGTAWPDALTGAAFAAAIGAPVFLPDPAFMAFPSWTYLTSDDSSKNWPIKNVYVFGGPMAIDAKTFAYVKRVTNAH